LALGAVREWLPQNLPQHFTPKINFFAFSFPLKLQALIAAKRLLGED
jgi:hypothetical protein